MVTTIPWKTIPAVSLIISNWSLVFRLSGVNDPGLDRSWPGQAIFWVKRSQNGLTGQEKGHGKPARASPNSGVLSSQPLLFFSCHSIYIPSLWRVVTHVNLRITWHPTLLDPRPDPSQNCPTRNWPDLFDRVKGVMTPLFRLSSKFSREWVVNDGCPRPIFLNFEITSM